MPHLLLRRSAAASAFALLLALAGCASTALKIDGPDATLPEDAATDGPVDVDGSVGEDGGVIGLDGGSDFDGGVVVVDGGSATDGGVVEVDAGMDGSIIERDGSVIGMDAGFDAGTRDGGVIGITPSTSTEDPQGQCPNQP